MTNAKKNEKHYRFTTLILALLLLWSLCVPGMAANGGGDLTETPGGQADGELIGSLSLDIQTALPSSSNVYVAGFCQDSAGNYYMMGSANGAIAGGSSSKSGIFVSKFDENLNELDTELVLVSQKEDIYHNGDPSTGYVFAAQNSTYEIYQQSLYNGAMAVDDSGNIYIAVRNSATKSLLYDWEDLYYEFMGECICDEYMGMSCDDDECDWGETTDCPVCDAYRDYKQSFVPGAYKELILCKINGTSLALEKRFIIATDARTSASSNDTWPRAYDIDLDSSGNIYVSGSMGGNILTDPVYGFNDFVNNQSSGPVADDDLIYGRGFLVKIDAGMTNVEKSTYFAGPAAYGGGRSSNAVVSCIAVDGGDIYIAGQDCGGKLPNTSGAFSGWMKANDSTSRGGFVAKLNKDSFVVERTTYIGGSGGSDFVNNLVVDNSAVYIAGTTTSNDMQTHDGAFLRVNSSGNYAQIYLARLSKDLSGSGYIATYFGSQSSRHDQFGLDIDAAGNFYITGETAGAYGFPTTDGSNAGKIYVSKLDSGLTQNLASTIIHPSVTSSDTQGRGIKVLADGSVVVAGQDVKTTAFIEKYSASFPHSKILSVQNSTSYNSSNQYYGTGREITIYINFSTFVAVTGEPTLKLNVVDSAGTNVEADYVSGSGTKRLEFSYTVQEGDSTNGSLLNCFDENSLLLNGGSILPAAGGTAADIDLTTPTSSSNLPNAKIYINTVPAKVKNVTSSITDGTYSNGAVIPIFVEFDGDIASVSGGTPTLELNSGGEAVYTNINSANKKQLIFSYTVGAADASQDLDYGETGSLKLNGASVKDNYGMDAVITLPAPGGEGALAYSKNIVIDSTVPYIESVKSDNEPGFYKADAEISVKVKFSDPIDKTGTVKMSLSLGTNSVTLTHTENVSDSDTLEFGYTVVGGQNANPLNFSSGNLILEPGASITQHGTLKSASLALPPNNQDGDLGTQGIIIDTTAPTCKSSPSVLKNSNDNVLSSGRYYKEGDRIGLRVPVNEIVTVNTGGGTSLPTIEINYKGDGADNKVMTYDSSSPNGSTGTYLYFYYEVEADDYLKNGNLLMNPAANWKISCAPGQIIDQAGNDLDPPLYHSSMVSPIGSIYFDTDAPEFAAGITASFNGQTNKVDVSWTKPTDTNSGLSRVYIGRRLSSGGNIVDLTDFAGSASTVTYEDETAVSGRTYKYVVYAIDNAGNVSEYQWSDDVTIGGTAPDSSPPAWTGSAQLMVERLSSTSAKLSWNTAQVVDSSDTGIKAFKVYKKVSDEWEYIGQTADGATSNYTVSGINDGAWEFKVTVLNNDDLESENSITNTVGAIEDFLLAILDTKGNVLKYIYDIDLTNDNISNQHYSGTNSYGNTSWYGVTGIYVDRLLAMAGVSNYESVSFVAGGGSSPVSMTKDFVEGTDRYYFGGDDHTDKKQVKPMISLEYTEYEISGDKEYELPKFVEDNPAGIPLYGQLRLFFGQAQYRELNRPYFLKDIYWLVVDVKDSGQIDGNPIINGVTAGTSTIYQGDPIPAEFPEASELTATDANGNPIDSAGITRTVTALNNPSHNPDELSSDTADIYTVTYSAVDSDGNESQVVRLLIVLPPYEPLGVYDVNIVESPSYTVSSVGGIPQAEISGIDNGDTVEVRCTIDEIEEYEEGISVVFTHYRGKKMISIMSQTDDGFVSGGELSVAFSDVRNGDVIRIFVVDQLDGIKENATHILFN